MGLLAGVKVIEMAGLTPGPFCGLMLADIRPKYGLSDLYLGIGSARAVFCTDAYPKGQRQRLS
jgi:hypothetical protein